MHEQDDGAAGAPAPDLRRLADPESVANAVQDPARLAALGSTELLDTGPEESFDRLTRLAVELLNAPVSLVSLVDEQRQFLKSAAGIEGLLASERETALSHSICQYVVAADAPLVIDDTRSVDALRDNGAVDELGVAAYAGVPIRGPQGAVYGSFCVMDSQPRPWSPRELAVLQELGAAAAAEIALRARLARATLHDPLTGLPNRARFLAQVQERLDGMPGQVLAVLAIEVEGLRAVEASLGRQAAEKMLVGIAARLKPGLAHDVVLGRVGDDRLALLCGRLAGEREALRTADRVRDLLMARPIEVGGHSLHPFPTIGIALGEAGDGAQDLLEGAVTALREAKRVPEQVRALGGQRLRDDAVQRLRTETALRFAIQRDRLRVFYQPKVRLADRSLIGFEALLRWDDPERGGVAPSTFIPLAEASGLIGPLGHFVLGEACRQAAEWRGAFPGLDLSMAVNLSPRQIQESDVATLIKAALAASDLPARHLTVEVTESFLMQGDQEVILSKLREFGVSVDLDDFGTGYSSLSRLAALPLDALKIDRSFVNGFGDRRMEAIVHSIIGMAAALGLQVTAEGIETEAQLEQLKEMGCQVGQGYLFAAPAPAEELTELLQRAELARTSERAGSAESLPSTRARAA